MSAAGFTWCYLVILGGIFTGIEVTADDGTVGPILSEAAAQAFADLGYMVIIFPIIGSGIAITVHSWGVFWRQRNFSSGATAGWNSFAQVYNVMGAMREIPGATSRLGDFFGGSSSSSDSKGKGGAIVLALVAVAVVGGCLTTWAIVRMTARSTAFNRRMSYSAQEA